MKALSVKPPWATAILMSQKIVECRTWKTDYRGDLLICASTSPWWAGSICKNALCVVRLADIEPFGEKHLEPAFMDEMPEGENYAWLLDSLFFIEPFEVKGKLHIYDVDDFLIKPKDPTESYVAFAERCYKPLIKWEDKYATCAEIEGIWEDWMGFLKELDRQAGLLEDGDLIIDILAVSDTANDQVAFFRDKYDEIEEAISSMGEDKDLVVDRKWAECYLAQSAVEEADEAIANNA